MNPSDPLMRLGGGRPGGSRELLVLAAPVVVSNASSTLMSLVDTAFAGWLGAAEVAAVGLSGIVIWSVFSFLNGTLLAVNTFVAQFTGAGDRRGAGEVAWNGLYLATLGILPAVALYAVAEPLYGAITSADVAESAVTYTHIRVWALVFFAFIAVFDSFMRGYGDTRTPMYITVSANAINVVASYALVFGELGAPELGVAGAAYGTLIAQVVGFSAYATLFLFSPRCRSFGTFPVPPPRAHLMRRILRVGLPIGAQWIVDMGSFTVFNMYVGGMGTAALAVTTIVIQIQAVSYMQMGAVGHASTTLVGKYIGAGQPEVARRSGRSALQIGALYGIAVAVIFVWFRESLVGLFNDDPRVLELGAVVILYSAAMQLLDAPGIALSGALRGAGDTRFIFWAGAICSWVIMLPLAYAMGTWAGLGVEGAWFSMVAWATALSLLIVGRFLRGRWLELKI